MKVYIFWNQFYFVSNYIFQKGFQNRLCELFGRKRDTYLINQDGPRN